jgi:hypothetical protein
MPAMRAFRLRIALIGYLTGLASLIEQRRRLADVTAESIKTFGSGKGLLAAILVCADWLGCETADGRARERLKHAKEVLDVYRRNL